MIDPLQSAGDAVASPREADPTSGSNAGLTGRTLGNRSGPDLRTIMRSGGTLVGLVILVAGFGIARPDAFLTLDNGRTILEQISILAVAAAAQTIVMVVGDFDLSVGAVASVSGAVVAQLLVNGTDIWVALLVGISIGAFVGIVNGFLVAYFQLSAFVVTLAMMTTVFGFSYIVTNGASIFGLPAGFLSVGQGKVLGFPTLAVIAVVVIALVALALGRTTLGLKWHAVGGNPEASRLSGVNVGGVRLAAFVATGAGAALAGILLTSRLATAQATAGDPLTLNSIAAVFLGMTMFRIGQPNIAGTVVGVAILGVLSNGLNIVGISSYVQQVLTGMIIIAAVSISRLTVSRA